MLGVALFRGMLTEVPFAPFFLAKLLGQVDDADNGGVGSCSCSARLKCFSQHNRLNPYHIIPYHTFSDSLS